MEFFPGTGYSPEPSPQRARRVPSTSSRERYCLFRHPLRRIAQRDRALVIMRPGFSANWRTAADAKSVHDHLSRHHAGSINERARFDISLSTTAYMPAWQIEQSPSCASACLIPPRAAPRSGPRAALGTALRAAFRTAAHWGGPGHCYDHATFRLTGNSMRPRFASVAVVNSLRTRTCGTMLALTSH